jgi:formate hydrogenlyase transcriptional activator
MCPESEGASDSPLTTVQRYQVLLAMADTLKQRGGLPELFHELAKRLREVVAFDFISFCLHEPAHSAMCLNHWEGTDSPAIPFELPVGEAVSGWVWEHQKPLVFDDIFQETGFPRVLNLLRERGAHSYCMLPLTVNQNRLGALGFASRKTAAFSRTDLRFLAGVADLVAPAVENSMTRQLLRREKQRLEALLEVSGSLASHRDFQQLVPAISASLRRVLQHDYATVDIADPGQQNLCTLPLDSPLARQVVGAEITAPIEELPAGRALREREVKFFTRADLEALNSPMSSRLLAEGIQSMACIPLLTTQGAQGALSVGSMRSAFEPDEMELLRQLAAPLAIALENARSYQEIAELKNRLEEHKLYLEDEIRTELNFEEIVGESPSLREVLSQVEMVASSDATVLILGETGTGKELIARAIHNHSARNTKSFIKINCAAIPTGLLESELFGHEKGAFTGAIMQKLGRLELADQGTLFLDEVGDIPLELQPKLLRVLQDQEFERLGGTRTIKVNVRLVAATNRELAVDVAQREFRSDLFYRLNVFPVRVPPLRDRRNDIPLLVRYFVQRIARRMNKPIETISSETMSALCSWDWPGNVRELENFIERGVILTPGKVLQVPLAELRPLYESGKGHRDNTLETAEREHILRMLRETAGVISGPRGAAARLGLKRTTLQSKMQKLGISRHDYQN